MMRKFVTAAVLVGALAAPASAAAVAANFVAAPNPGLAGHPIYFNGSLSTPFTFQIGCPSNIASYSWSFGDGATASGQSVQHTYAGGGSYAASLTVASDAEWCATSTKTQTITVLQVP
ncbi:MAG: hypothetical protein QOE06_1226 [Thermoleophilaceae bacterium]|jgi:PKD repeat protein|nr:hypothetical protein [Thermoleophilaceae bacterium]